jgi:hypothetical protein
VPGGRPSAEPGDGRASGAALDLRKARFGNAELATLGETPLLALLHPLLGDIASKAMSGGEVAAKEVVIRDMGEERRTFVAAAFFNRHTLFVMVTAKKAARFGRRIRGVAS